VIKMNSIEENDISVEAAIKDSGVSLTVRSKFVSAVDHLCGHAIAFLGRKLVRGNEVHHAQTLAMADEIRVRADARNIVIKAAGARMAKLVAKDNAIAAEVYSRAIAVEAQKQENLDQVMIEAAKDIISSAETQGVDSTKNEFDLDWMNNFRDFAEKASSDKMRQIFGRILSGEIKKSGSFSMQTVRLVFEMDQRTAEQFQRIAPYRFNKCLPYRIPAASHDDWFKLSDAGLVEGVGGYVAILSEKDKEGIATMLGEKYVIFAQVEEHPRSIRRRGIGCYKLTSSGAELAALFPNDELEAIKLLVENFELAFDRIDVHLITERRVDSFTYDEEPIYSVAKASK
jgi:hypothetical protein